MSVLKNHHTPQTPKPQTLNQTNGVQTRNLQALWNELRQALEEAEDGEMTVSAVAVLLAAACALADAVLLRLVLLRCPGSPAT